jgi:hypothetical protein
LFRRDSLHGSQEAIAATSQRFNKSRIARLVPQSFAETIPYFLARDWKTKEPKPLDSDVVRMHLNGDITINLYAINSETQRSKWVAIDADYEGALDALFHLKWELKQDGVEAERIANPQARPPHQLDDRSHFGSELVGGTTGPLVVLDCGGNHLFIAATQ